MHIRERFYMKKLVNGKEIYPGVVVFDDVIKNPKKIIKDALKEKNGWRDSQVAGDFFKGEDGITNKEIRDTRIFDISPVFANHHKYFKIAQTIWRYGNEYAITFNEPFSMMENPQLLHYYPNQGFYKPHADSGPGMPRNFSCLLYLNDVEEGGETYFNRINLMIEPRAGRLVLFPANYVYSHEAKTPISNDKFVIVTWFHPY